jgi:hypothetical protein
MGINGQGKNQEKFVPDISINNVLFLLDRESILNTIGDQLERIIEDENPARVLLKNRDGSQYLILYQCYGCNSNSFNEFEVGYLMTGRKYFKKTKFNFFFASNIKLGITKKRLIFLKGTGYKKTNKNGNEILEYRITGEDNQFLLNYNAPIYIASYYFNNNKLIKFRFGLPVW